MSLREDLEPDDEIGGYRIEALLGRGGMGLVYRACQLTLDRPVALKLLAPHLAGDAAFLARFERETRIAAGLGHPAVLPVYDAGVVDGRPFVALRLIEGEDLAALLAR